MEYFHFNQYSSILLIGWLQGMIFAVMLWLRSYRWDRIADRFAALLIFVCCTYVAQWMLGFANWYDARNWQATVMFYVPWSNFLVMGPLVYFTFISLTNTQFEWKKKYWWHFVPFLFFFLEPLGVFLHDFVWEKWIQGMPFPEEHFSGTRGSWAEFLNTETVPLFRYINIASRLHLLAYLVLTIIAFNQYRQYVREHFANEERYSLNWLRMLLFVFVIGIGMSWLINIVGYFTPINYTGSWYGHFAMAVTIYILSIRLYMSSPDRLRALHFEPKPVQESLVSSTPEARTALEPDDETLMLSEQMVAMMETNQLYLDPELNLGSLAEKLHTNTSVLSKVINVTQEQNFNDFINSYRSREVMRRLENGDHERLTFLSIAIEAGFNSKATFNRAFKKYTGKTPRQFISVPA
ncbi:MAG: helix-turn-helix domain-containing protein [Bacteroidia bacterium]